MRRHRASLETAALISELSVATRNQVVSRPIPAWYFARHVPDRALLEQPFQPVRYSRGDDSDIGSDCHESFSFSFGDCSPPMTTHRRSFISRKIG
jgi:hypothetical protein